MEFRTALVVVLYNQYCGNSVTCKTINEGSLQPDTILMIDNSTKEMNNLNYCEKQGWTYHSMGGNAGLSKAYNTAISVLQNKADVVIWADDDTVFPPDYMEKLVEYVSNNPGKDVFLPVVKSKTMILSPAIYTKRRIIAAKQLLELEKAQLSAINSGMAVRLSLYDNYRYDESIFLDYVDHDFMRWCRLNGRSMQIMDDVQLFQNFFAEGNSSYAAVKHRMKIYCKDIRVYEAKCGKHRLFTEWDLLKHCHYQYYKIMRTRLNDSLNKKFKSTNENGG